MKFVKKLKEKFGKRRQEEKRQVRKQPLFVVGNFNPPFSLVAQSTSPEVLWIGDEILSYVSGNTKFHYEGKLFSDGREDVCVFPQGSFAYKILNTGDDKVTRCVYYPLIPIKDRDIYVGNRIYDFEKYEKIFKREDLSELMEKEDTELYYDGETKVRKGRGYLGTDTSPFVTPHCDLEVIEKFYKFLRTPFDYSVIITPLNFEVSENDLENAKYAMNW